MTCVCGADGGHRLPHGRDREPDVAEVDLAEHELGHVFHTSAAMVGR